MNLNKLFNFLHKNSGNSDSQNESSKLILNRNWLKLYIAISVSRFGDIFNLIGLVILVYQLTKSGLDVSTLALAEIFPILVLGFVGGVCADRYSRRRLMMGADVLRFAFALLLVLFYTNLIVIYIAAVGLSIGTVFFAPASKAILPNVICDSATLSRANSLLWSSAIIGQIALAPFAGLLIETFGVRLPFSINCFSFLFSAVLISRLKLTTKRGLKIKQKWVQQIKDGYIEIKSHRFLKFLAVIQAIAALSAGATSALLIVLAKNRLKAGPFDFSILLGAIGIGALIGPIVFNKLMAKKLSVKFIYLPYIIRSLVDLTIAFSPFLLLTLSALILYGIATSMGSISFTTFIQKRVSDNLQGKVYAFFDVLWHSLRLISVVAGGFVADTFGISVVYIIGGLLLLVAGILGHVLLSEYNHPLENNTLHAK